MKKRIIYVTNMAQYGGIESYVMNVLRNIDHSRYQIDFLRTTNTPGPYDDELQLMGCRFFCVPNPSIKPGDIFIHLRAFRQAMSGGRSPAAFHFHACTAYACFDALMARHYSRNIIVHSHNSSVDGVRRRVLHYLTRHSLCILSNHRIACSKKAGKWMFGNKNFELLPNGIEVDRFRFDTALRDKTRQGLGIRQETLLIGAVGRLTETKNHIFLIKVMKHLIDQNVDCKLLLVGDGPLKEELRERSRELDIETTVIFAGNTSAVHRFYNAMDIFAMPSLYEGLPFVCVEAQINNLPCVLSTEIDSEAVLTERTVQIPIDSPKRWVKMIREISQNMNDRNAPVDRALVDKWSIRNVVMRVQNLYER